MNLVSFRICTNTSGISDVRTVAQISAVSSQSGMFVISRTASRKSWSREPTFPPEITGSMKSRKNGSSESDSRLYW